MILSKADQEDIQRSIGWALAQDKALRMKSKGKRRKYLKRMECELGRIPGHALGRVRAE